MNDPIVDEIRKYRDEHSKLFNYDLDAICNDLKSKHKQYIEKLEQLKKKNETKDPSKRVSRVSC